MIDNVRWDEAIPMDRYIKQELLNKYEFHN